jgi:hypothetical protein
MVSNGHLMRPGSTRHPQAVRLVNTSVVDRVRNVAHEISLNLCRVDRARKEGRALEQLQERLWFCGIEGMEVARVSGTYDTGGLHVTLATPKALAMEESSVVRRILREVSQQNRTDIMFT